MTSHPYRYTKLSICLRKNGYFVCLRWFDFWAFCPFSVLTLQCFDPSVFVPSVFWLFNVLTLQLFLPVTHYRPSTPLFGKIGYEMFHGIFFLIIYARSENGDKERSLEHVQPGVQKPQHSSMQCQIRNPSIRKFKSGINLLIIIIPGTIEIVMSIRGWERLCLFSAGMGWT